MKFYKYASWTGDKGAYTRANLLNNAVYLASPTTFNDPFDYNLVYDFSGTRRELENHLESIIREHENLSKNKANSKAKKIVRDDTRYNSERGLKILMEENKDAMRKNCGVSCFTTSPESPLMWAHYADSHMGVCLEWDLPEWDSKEFFSLPATVKKEIPLILKKVEYLDERPVSKFFGNEDQMGKNLLKGIFTKSIDWKYEDEYRLIELRYTGISNYSPDRLSGIIIGYKMAEEQIQEVKDFVKKMSSHPKIFKVELDEKRFKYNVVPLL